jgi:N6-L-threonylcarbamoyladenine synthase
VERAARAGDAARFRLPRPMLGRADANFSLSGLKTAVRMEATRIGERSAQDVADLCAGFQAAALESVADRLRVGLSLFAAQFGAPTALVAAGGVASNEAVRAMLDDVARDAGAPLMLPPPALCTDNGAMIAWAGAERLALGLRDPMNAAPRARWRLDEGAPAASRFAHSRAAF